MARLKVFFDVTIDGEPAGRTTMELYVDTSPGAAGEFRSLCRGDNEMGICGKPLHFKGTPLPTVFSNSICGNRTADQICIYSDKHYALGKVVDGFELLKAVKALGVDTTMPIVIADCGKLS